MRPGIPLRWHALKNILKSEIEAGSVILDIGGYDGYISHKLRGIFPHLKIAVVDVDKSGLGIARECDLNAICASGLALPVGDNRIDVVLCLDIIEHIEEDYLLISEISRVLKKKGKIILTTPMQNGISFPFLSREKTDALNKSWGHFHKGFSLEKIKMLFEKNGLKIVTTGSFFNLISRFVYRFAVLSGVPLRGKGILYRLIILLEPYIKYRAEEHLVIGEKTES